MSIKRHIESSIINTLNEQNKVVVIYGPRQVGKTTMVKNILQQFDQPNTIINGDRKDHHTLISSRDLGQLKALLGNTEILFVDEAQNIPEIGINIKILKDELSDLKIIITGSSSLDLANKMQEPLTGRTDTYMLFPISIGELARDTSPSVVNEQLTQFLLYGTYPEILSITNKEKKIKALKELSTSYLYKDILALGNIKYSQKLRNLVKLLAYQIGQLVSIQELSQSLQISQDTVVNYIDKLEKAFVVYRLSSLSENPRKEISKRDKIYFYDIGIRNAVINNFEDIMLRSDKGFIWENFMITERIKRNHNYNSYAATYFWRTYGGAEIDLIEQYDEVKDGYEFKFSNKKTRPPASWINGYHNSSFKMINRDNYLPFLLDKGQ